MKSATSPPSQADTADGRTLSGEAVEELYTEADLPAGIGGRAGIHSVEDPLGRPGQYPFTRGVYESMYRGRLWTMRQFAGFGTSEETNERFHYLLEHGQTGLSTAFDMPSLMGLDSDSPRSLGEIGREGVAVDTVQDMKTLFAGIDLGEVSVSMTINAPAAIMLAFYVAGGILVGARTASRERRAGRREARTDRAAAERLSGTIQADILKEYIAQKEWCFPIDPAMRLCGDMIEWCTRRMPRWHPISISGYHIREAGATAQQELAFTLADGLTYVRQAVERGLDVDEFAPRLSFFFNAQIDLFEEIAKYRAARRIWAREMRETFGAKNPRSWLMRFHAQTAGVSLTAQQPLNNIIRTTVEALAAVLGGAQSLHTNSYDEALALPTEEAVRIALRTQQVIAHETGVAGTADPLGRQLLRGGDDRSYGGALLRVLREDRATRGHGRGRQAQLPPARDRRRGVRAAAADRRRRARGGRRQQPRARGRAAAADPAHRPGPGTQAARPPAVRARHARRRTGGAHARRAARGGGAARSQPDGAAA